MQHFFVDRSALLGNKIIITGEDVNHIKNVLRMKIGEEISVGNGEDDNEYRCEIESIEEDKVICNLLFIKESGVELPAEVYLFQGLPKNDKMELIIQKAVELGVCHIVPVATKRAVVKLDDKKAKSKVIRWQAISEAAAKQSQRAVIPKVHDVMTFKEAVNFVGNFESKVIPYELSHGMDETKRWISKVSDDIYSLKEKGEKDNINAYYKIAIFIGPEGGFDENEIEIAKGAGVMPISLGRRILRTETAGMTTLSILMYSLEII